MERSEVGCKLVPGLLERDEDPWLSVLERAADEELHREERLAASCPAADERGAAGGQAAARDLVQTADAGRNLLEGRDARSHFLWSHLDAPAMARGDARRSRCDHYGKRTNGTR